MVLALAGPEPGELAPPELEMLSRSLVGTLLRLARERDVGAQVRGGRRRKRRTTGTQPCAGGVVGGGALQQSHASCGAWGQMWGSWDGLLLTPDL